MSIDIYGDCDGYVFEEYGYEEEPCCRCRRNINLLDEYISDPTKREADT